ncbi:uncharacterized protein LOC114314078, partial [Camellia sinensis]|uniref:uncharacterized protein LOC114314078 n=1 Tax=Camellia sinensis TaxID=4442 RepID=UPI001036A3DC
YLTQNENQPTYHSNTHLLYTQPTTYISPTNYKYYSNIPATSYLNPYYYYNAKAYYTSPKITISTVENTNNQLLPQIYSSHQPSTTSSTNFTEQQLVYWQPPKEGWLKLNFDGGIYPNKEAPKQVDAIRAGIFQDHKGICIYAFGDTIPMTFVEYVEASALCRGLQIAAENEWPKIWAEGDAEFLIETILHNTQRDYGSIVWKLIGNIRRRKQNFQDCKITFIRREGNSAADAICNHIKGKYGNFQYDDNTLPRKIKNIVHQERQGYIYTHCT